MRKVSFELKQEEVKPCYSCGDDGYKGLVKVIIGLGRGKREVLYSKCQHCYGVGTLTTRKNTVMTLDEVIKFLIDKDLIPPDSNKYRWRSYRLY